MSYKTALWTRKTSNQGKRYHTSHQKNPKKQLTNNEQPAYKTAYRKSRREIDQRLSKCTAALFFICLCTHSIVIVQSRQHHSTWWTCLCTTLQQKSYHSFQQQHNQLHWSSFLNPQRLIMRHSNGIQSATVGRLHCHSLPSVHGNGIAPNWSQQWTLLHATDAKQLSADHTDPDGHLSCISWTSATQLSLLASFPEVVMIDGTIKLTSFVWPSCSPCTPCPGRQNTHRDVSTRLLVMVCLTIHSHVHHRQRLCLLRFWDGYQPL